MVVLWPCLGQALCLPGRNERRKGFATVPGCSMGILMGIIYCWFIYAQANRRRAQPPSSKDAANRQTWYLPSPGFYLDTAGLALAIPLGEKS